tara:strand:- start:37 stop:774 length:738 start_codon:yes stop_codon:yes gene_type:complete
MKELNYFKKNGFVIFRNLLNKKILKKCLIVSKNINFKKYNKNKNVVFDSLNKNKKTVKYFQHIETFYPEFYKLQNTKILEIAKKLFKQDAFFCSMGLHNKAPGNGTPTPFHQDNFFNRKKPPYELTAYIPLEKQDKRNGSITYIKKSHKKGVLRHKPSKTKAFSATLKDNIVFNKNNIYKTKLNPGDVVFHHTNIIHGAERNNSKKLSRFSVSVSIVGVKAKTDKNLDKLYKRFLKLNRYSKKND